MREFANPVLLGRGGAPVSLPSIWDRKSGGDMVPVTPRRLILMACWTMRDGRPDDLAFSRKTNKVLDQLEPQEKNDSATLSIDTESLEHIRLWVNIDVAKAWPVDAPFIVDGFDKVIDGQKEEAEKAPEASSDGHEGEEAMVGTNFKPRPLELR